jgi:hypothetical protein
MTTDNLTESSNSCFTSQLPFDSSGCGTAVVFCSDGRFGDQVDDFMRNGLRLRGYDRLAIAGGPACLAGHQATPQEEQGAIFHVQFLAGLRGLTRLILISHEDCGFYRQILKVDQTELLDRIRLDLASAALRLNQMMPRLKVEAFLARLHDGQVLFEPVGGG